MNFFSRIFGKSRQKKNAEYLNLSGNGHFNAEVVGESHYQKRIENICGGKSEESLNKIVQALLVPEDDNPYDNLAIRVDIFHQTVGYLSKTQARYFRKKLEINCHKGAMVYCPAKIVGGQCGKNENMGLLGVFLDLPEEYIEPDNVISTNEDEKSIVLIFELDKVDKNEILHCKQGDSVKIWKPPENAKNIFVYRSGTCGGFGMIGKVPDMYLKKIAQHIEKGLDIESKIERLTEKVCVIGCKLISEKERQERIKEEAKVLKSEITKKYKPQKGFILSIQLPKNHNLQVGKILYLKENPIEYYLQQPNSPKIDFVDETNNLVAYKHYESNLIVRILRASYSDYKIDFKIISIDTPDKYTLPYIDWITAKAEVTFSK